jgi:hypothetical protein
MMFWLLTLILLASLAGIGYRQGAIRVAFSLVGILFGALLAAPLGRLIKPLVTAFGVKNPILAGALGPLLIFIVVSVIFKVAAFYVHQKVDVHFKYHAGDLRLALWERLNRRLGLCLGLVNALLYLILISFVIYVFGYWTVQLSSADKDPRLMRLVTQLARDLQSTGFAKVARAVDPLPQTWYDAADLAGVIYNNPLCEARLARYPAFLILAERPEFQEMSSDQQFTELLLRPAPIMEILDHPKAQAIIQNPASLKQIWAIVLPDLKDVPNYLVTARSAKYESERILGRWNFNVDITASVFRRAKPNITAKEMQAWKRWMAAAFAKTTFVAMTDHQAILKNIPQVRLPVAGATSTGSPQTLKGQWKNLDTKYDLSLTDGAKEESLSATVDGDRLTISTDGLNLVFEREI